jgi:hypothetical protein
VQKYESGVRVADLANMYSRHVKPRSPEGHLGHICVVMRATHDMRPAGRMFDMPDLQNVFFVQNVFYPWK